jgi:predicted phosphodiesterase
LSQSASPTTSSATFVTKPIQGKGEFSITVSGLDPNTTYYIKAYAISNNVIYYGEEVSFKTLSVITVPVLTSTPASAVTTTGATLGGAISSNGGSDIVESGICYGLSANPEIDNSTKISTNPLAVTGSFSINLTNLQSNKIYYARAYARNSLGVSYGVQVTFSTYSEAITSSADVKKVFFNGSKEFKIVQFTDIHFYSPGGHAYEDVAFINSMLDIEKPDLVVYTGDIVHESGLQAAWLRVLTPCINRNIPYAVVFGNHDTETNATLKSLLANSIAGYQSSLMQASISGVSGNGNYFVPIYSKNTTTTKAVLWFFDSHSYASEFPSDAGATTNYGWIDKSQVDWYKSQSDLQQTANNGAPYPGLAFFHIPLQEYKPAFDAHIYQPVGLRGESECYQGLNTGLFAAFKAKGNVQGTFCGHDHLNNYLAYKDNIALCYGRFSGAVGDTYGYPAKGVRVIKLFEDQPGVFETYIRVENDDNQYYHLTVPKNIVSY